VVGETAAHLNCNAVVTRVHAVGDEQQSAEIRIKTIFTPIQKIAGKAIYIVNPFEIDAKCSGITGLGNPTVSKLALAVKKEALAVLCLDRRIDNEAGRPNRISVARQGIYPALFI